jgi:hypothetical protein
MAVSKKTPPPEPRVTLSALGDGAIAVYPWRVYRFLLDTGKTLDVTAIVDDSYLREAVLKYTGATRIEGSANMGEAVGPPQRRVVKRSS